MCTTLIESFLPDAHQKYVCLNYMQSSQYRSYKSSVPEYLRDRPKTTILHCLERKSKALKYVTDDIKVVDSKQGIFTIEGSKNKKHTINFGIENEDGMPSCTCPDWQQWHIPCKHFFAEFNLQSGWAWSNLHPKYLNSPYLCTDSHVLHDYFHNTASNESLNTDSLNSSTDSLPSTNGSHNPIQTELPKRKVC